MEYTQSALVEGIRKEDKDAYEYLITKYSKMIYYLAYHILSQNFNKEDIEECVSDVLLDAWIKIDDFDAEKSNFRTWLLVLTKYKALTYKRKKKDLKIISLEDYELRDTYNLEDQIILRQDQEKVIKTIQSFNKTDKEIFLRRYFFGEKICDLAKDFNLSRSAIDNRLLRGRKILKEVLNNE